jgi:hypothetical protein
MATLSGPTLGLLTRVGAKAMTATHIETLMMENRYPQIRQPGRQQRQAHPLPPRRGTSSRRQRRGAPCPAGLHTRTCRHIADGTLKEPTGWTPGEAARRRTRAERGRQRQARPLAERARRVQAEADRLGAKHARRRHRYSRSRCGRRRLGSLGKRPLRQPCRQAACAKRSCALRSWGRIRALTGPVVYIKANGAAGEVFDLDDPGTR